MCEVQSLSSFKCRYFDYLRHVRVYNLVLYAKRLRGLRRVCTAACLLVLRVRIPPGAAMSVSWWVLCAVRYRSLRRADHSSRGVLRSVVCLSLITKPG